MPKHLRLGGLRGMAYAAAAVTYTHRTASWLSNLFNRGRTIRGNQSSCHAERNSKIVYQYLRGEREPSSGRRGKYGHDLTGTVRALPGGVTAYLWSTSPIWELIKGTVSVEFVRGILSLIEEPLPGMPALSYIRAWALYRLSILEQASPVEQRERSRLIASLHSTSYAGDPVFNYICGPLRHYLLEFEPQIPIKRPTAAPSPKSRLSILMKNSFRRYLQKQNRFENGIARHQLSGRQPDRRFKHEFSYGWDAYRKFNDDLESLHAELDVSRHPESGWKILFEAWNIPTCTTKYLAHQIIKIRRRKIN
ncbi:MULTISPECIES: hypothetical protein [unclassified Burkholderia]|uniref:hypothetical protein n=1 Tax=unclassified Burkholderia TaxID=2613784 RepID=UPI00197D7DD6|nr:MULTISPECIES: hypothetical protein [unclassified Burkholderia]MBN3769279.1 hypothetical protein [Burkholderia sp. Se-20378]MBN3793991.1 hypothetical protein [Burkholderia sp. Ac-20392]